MAILWGTGEVYPDLEPFSLIELRKHIDVYFIHRLAPSPHVSMKFKLQRDNVLNGNDFVKTCLVPNAERICSYYAQSPKYIIYSDY